MGKSVVCGVRLNELSRIVSSANGNAKRATHKQPRSPNRVAIPAAPKSQPAKLKMERGEEVQCRKPLSDVVANCANRWFHETLKEAKAGDAAMQLLVAQMYYSGYGVPRNLLKGNAWISKASRNRNSVWRASDRHIGYRTSDSDSYEPENKVKFSP